MASRTSHIHFSGRGARLNTLTRQTFGSGIGSVLLDGGIGGQSSYHSLEDYYNTNRMIDQELVFKWFRQLVSALKYLHSKKVHHRDLKPL